VVEFPATASFHRTVAEKPENEAILADVIAEVTGRRLALTFAVGEDAAEDPHAEEARPTSEEEFVSLFKSTFDAREVEEE
jgi:hypothetical protein